MKVSLRSIISNHSQVLLLALSAALFPSAAVHAQTSSSNVQLVAQWSQATNSIGQAPDMATGSLLAMYYGYGLTTGRDFRIVDLHNPTAPFLLGQCPSYCARIVTNPQAPASYAYGIGYDTGGPNGGRYQFRSIRISLPFASQTGTLLLDGTPGGLAVTGSFADNGHAYVSGFLPTTEYNSSAGLQVINIANPDAPFVEGRINLPSNNFAYSMEVQGNLAYLITGVELFIVDISNPAAPKLVGKYTPLMNAGINAVAVSGRFVYLGSGSQLQTLNVSNPAFPILVSSVTALGSVDNITIEGDYAYLGISDRAGFSMGGVEIEELANPALPKRVGYYTYSGNGLGNKALLSGGNIYLGGTPTTTVLKFTPPPLSPRAPDALLSFAANFDGFFFDDFSGPRDASGTLLKGSSVQGPMAVGRNMDVAGFTVGRWTNAAVNNGLIVGNNLNFNGGTILGNLLYGGVATLGPKGVSVTGTKSRVNPLPVDFTAAQFSLLSLSQNLGNLQPNMPTAVQYYGSTTSITMTGTSPTVNIFWVFDFDLSRARNITINAPAGSTVLVNALGTSISSAGFSLQGGVAADHVLLNFPGYTSLTLKNIGLQGTILAPAADVSFYSGSISGQVIAESFVGSGTINHQPFTGFSAP
jgi:choice-of-anchor A domain-containing protein